jgi:hypothetical protein
VLRMPVTASPAGRLPTARSEHSLAGPTGCLAGAPPGEVLIPPPGPPTQCCNDRLVLPGGRARGIRR